MKIAHYVRIFPVLACAMSGNIFAQPSADQLKPTELDIRTFKHPSSQDKALIKAVRRDLARSSDLDSTNISVLARNGVVVLTGSVISLHDSALAVSIVTRVKGVVAVESKLVLRSNM
jgi:hyperosmotically inducible periplasmic protein